jgi:hypothetical protein
MEQKESEKSVVREIAQGKERLFEWLFASAVRFAPQLGGLLGLLVVLVGVYLFSPSATRSPAQVYASNLQLVKPGSFAPLACAEWNFLSHPYHNDYLLYITERMLDISKQTGVDPLTTTHIALNFCGMVYNGSVMLNPRIRVTSGEPERWGITSKLLCGNSSKPYILEGYPGVTLSWSDLENKRVARSFNDAEAYTLQVALAILEGKPLCAH